MWGKRVIKRFASAGEKEKKYDLCVIGAGAAGVAAAMRGSDMGKKVCLVENAETLGEIMRNKSG